MEDDIMNIASWTSFNTVLGMTSFAVADKLGYISSPDTVMVLGTVVGVSLVFELGKSAIYSDSE
jgi:hypothetical protein